MNFGKISLKVCIVIMNNLKYVSKYLSLIGNWMILDFCDYNISILFLY